MSLDTISNMAPRRPTRGERNNNPGNIRKTFIAWKGEVPGDDPAFEAFITPEMGIRALAKLLANYHAEGVDTVRGIINRYAPPSENDTAAYVNAVAQAIGVAPDDALDLRRYNRIYPLVQAIIRHENGRCIYNGVQLDRGIRMAGVFT